MTPIYRCLNTKETNAVPVCVTRRQLLWAGGTATLAASMGLIRILGTPPSIAYSPWELWNAPSLRGTPLALVAAGILAANPHNTQPWLLKVSDRSIEIWADGSRNLGAMDPFLREMHIGLGCAIENMALAAPYNGYAVSMEILPGSLTMLKPKETAIHAATLKLRKLSAAVRVPDLYWAIPNRHTNRYPYDPSQSLPPAWRQAVTDLAADPEIRIVLFEDGPRREAYDGLVIDATAAIIADKTMIADSDRWFRASPSEIEKYRSGTTLDAAGLSSSALAMARILQSILPSSASHAAWLAQTRDTQVATAPVAGLIAVKDRYDRRASIHAGRVWQRLHLAAALAGVAMQPLNQSMEMADREKELGQPPRFEKRLQELIGSAEWQPTFAFRAGIALRAAPASPRRDLLDAVMS